MYSHVGRHRAASVPVEPIRLLEMHGASTARRISNAAIDDTDAMMAASKRHDQQLLRDINNRLATQSLQRPPVSVVKRSTVTTSSPRKPPLPPAGRSNYSTITTSTVPARRSAASRYTDYDEDIDMMPPTPVTRSVIRASSVPPRLPATTSTRTSYTVNHDAPASTYWTSKPLPPPVNGPNIVGHWTTAYPDGINYTTYITEPSLTEMNGGYLPTRVTNPPGQIGPVADLAIRQAHRNLDRIEKELKHKAPEQTNTSYSPYYVPRSYVEVSPDRTSVRRPYYHRTPIVTSTPSSVRIRHASLSPARTINTTSSSSYQRQMPTSYRAESPFRPSDLISLVSTASRSQPAIEHEIMASYSPKLSNEIVELQLFPTEMYRTRAQPSMTSSYTTPYVPSYVSSTPVKHGNQSSFPQQESNVRPKVSETRQKVRDVLCKIKKDPHYFD